MSPDSKIFISLVGYLLVLMMLSLSQGCTPKRADPGVERAGEELSQRLNAIGSNAERIKPHANAVGRELAEIIKVDATEAKVPAMAIEVANASLRAELNAAHTQYSKLRNKLFVRVALWLERMLWIVGIAWAVLGIGSVVLGVSNPLGWTWRLGQSIRRFLPFSNPFGLVNDWLRSRQQPVKPAAVILKPKGKGK